ncbi:crotonobetainyl-CoA:carnitine CoA-transferase CaiB-like acyl-CoA transferase [Sphingobium sp. JAI105]|nr:crotonobetainyl-CoA:carnitine CoA-transferase CaiB-like acyl-CoA transferase [Sphingobium sp. JAI105]
MAHPYARERGLFLNRDHPDGGTVATIGPVPRLSRTPLQPGRPLRATMDAPDIMADIGLAEQVEAYAASGVITIRPSRKRAALKA